MREAQAQAEVRTVGFVFVSSVLHVALAIGILALKAQQTPPKDMVEIEILGGSSISAAASTSVAMPPPGTLPKASPVSEAPKVAAKAQAPAAQKITSVQQAPSPMDANEPLETPDLDEPKNISVAPQEQLNTEEFSKDLDQVDQESNVKVAALQKNLNSETDEALKEHENQTQQLKAQTAAENAVLAKQIEQTKSEAKAQQAVLAKAEAERQAQAQATAEQSAAAQVAAEQAALTKASQERMLAAKAAADQAQADKMAAENAAQTAAAEKAKANQQPVSSGNGVANNEVRSLNELRQVPGNDHPVYDSEDRLKGRQGDVAFLAYISRDGQPVKFKMVQSSGFRELDAKTLRAIRSWKFYPGQEGWVEIPFRWDLKGGPQEMPATLRRKISQF